MPNFGVNRNAWWHKSKCLSSLIQHFTKRLSRRPSNSEDTDWADRGSAFRQCTVWWGKPSLQQMRQQHAQGRSGNGDTVAPGGRPGDGEPSAGILYGHRGGSWAAVWDEEKTQAPRAHRVPSSAERCFPPGEGICTLQASVSSSEDCPPTDYCAAGTRWHMEGRVPGTQGRLHSCLVLFPFSFHWATMWTSRNTYYRNIITTGTTKTTATNPYMVSIAYFYTIITVLNATHYIGQSFLVIPNLA